MIRAGKDFGSGADPIADAPIDLTNPLISRTA